MSNTPEEPKNISVETVQAVTLLGTTIAPPKAPSQSRTYEGVMTWSLEFLRGLRSCLGTGDLRSGCHVPACQSTKEKVVLVTELPTVNLAHFYKHIRRKRMVLLKADSSCPISYSLSLHWEHHLTWCHLCENEPHPSPENCLGVVEHIIAVLLTDFFLIYIPGYLISFAFFLNPHSCMLEAEEDKPKVSSKKAARAGGARNRVVGEPAKQRRGPAKQDQAGRERFWVRVASRRRLTGFKAQKWSQWHNHTCKMNCVILLEVK